MTPPRKNNTETVRPYKPHKKQAEAHRSEADRKVLLWGRQVGKTVWAINHAWISGIRKQGRYFIIFPTYRQAKDTIWNQYLHFIPKQLIKQVNNSELTITMHHLENSEIILPDGTKEIINHDTNLPPSTIELKGSDEADSLRGMKASGLIFDEYALQNEEHWQTVFEPMLSTTGGWAAFISTPKGFNHFYDMVVSTEKGRANWWLSKATWRDNPSINPAWIKQVRREADEDGRLSAFLQEYELEFRSVEGAVYPEFNRDVHVVDPDQVPEEGTIFGAIDFGWDNPTAVNLVKIDKDNNWWIFDEIHLTRTQTKDVAEQIKNKMAGQRLVLMVGDSAQQESIDIIRTEGLPVAPVSKSGSDSITAGIGLVATKLKPRIQLIGDPKPKLYVTSNCKHTIQEFESYKYPSPKQDRNSSELPVKKDDHHMDAIRYLALHMKYDRVEDEKGKTNAAPKFSEYGLLND